MLIDVIWSTINNKHELNILINMNLFMVCDSTLWSVTVTLIYFIAFLMIDEYEHSYSKPQLFSIINLTKLP